jgi:hypothetical protein
VKLVSQASATKFVGSEESHNQISIDSDHCNLVTFLSTNDPNYIAVVEKLEEALDEFLKNMHPSIIEIYSS